MGMFPDCVRFRRSLFCGGLSQRDLSGFAGNGMHVGAAGGSAHFGICEHLLGTLLRFTKMNFDTLFEVALNGGDGFSGEGAHIDHG